jgi:hypothetical protein
MFAKRTNFYQKLQFKGEKNIIFVLFNYDTHGTSNFTKVWIQF